jgi:hypothetical protein
VPDSSEWSILCDSPELALECLRAAAAIELSAAPLLGSTWFTQAETALEAGRPIAICIAELPTTAQLIGLAQRARTVRRPLALALVRADADAARLRDLAADLGLVAVDDVGPLLGALALLASDAQAPWAASRRGLPDADRTRLDPLLGTSRKRSGQLERTGDGLLAFQPGAAAPVIIGNARDSALALKALRDADRDSPAVESSVDDVDRQAVADVLFGPARSLSDPASKAALLPYGLPMPHEELCNSPSRAAAEATRLGYPVRISLASPDLRVWDHPDLAVDMVDNAARVRDTFRQLLGLATGRLVAATSAESERLLGVMVTATSDAQALLALRLEPEAHGRVRVELGFADPHGRASDDRTLALLPAAPSAIERVLERLRGNALLLAGGPARRKQHVDSISEALLRLCAFVHDHRAEVRAVEIRPLALLADGSVEVREACVHVSDHYERSLLAAPRAAHG